MLGAIAAPAHAPAAPPAPPAKRSAVRPRVLVVDDEPLVLRLLGRTLEAEWDVVQATSGTEALALARDTAFDAILCDLMMPGFSGIQLAEQLEADAPGLRRRMVFLTGGAVSPEAQAFVARPDVLHVLKPVDLAELTRALRAVAGSRGA
jgi:CheY-like chemotaxis protein